MVPVYTWKVRDTRGKGGSPGYRGTGDGRVWYGWVWIAMVEAHYQLPTIIYPYLLYSLPYGDPPHYRGVPTGSVQFNREGMVCIGTRVDYNGR